MNEQEKWAYIAGLFDGEGSISMNQVNRKYCTIQCSLRITNTNKQIIDWLSKTVPYSFKTIQHHKSRPNARDAWHFEIHKQKAIKKFLEKLLPYLKIKKQQAELAIEWASHHVQYKKRYFSHRERDKLTGRYIECGQLIDRKWEEKIFKKMREINGKIKNKIEVSTL